MRKLNGLNLKDIAFVVERETGIKTYPRSVGNIIGALLVEKDFWGIVDLSDEPLPIVAETIKLLSKKGYVKLGKKEVELTGKGKKFADEEKIFPYTDLKCKICDGRGINLEEFKQLLEKFREVVKGRPSPLREFDQGYVTPETTVARVILMDARGDLKGKDVFVIGDDDLTSIALMLSDLPRSITILDIDERLIKFIGAAADKIGYSNLELLTFDLRKPLPLGMQGRFDTFLTDPPETIEAFKVFIGRGITALKGSRCAGYFGVTRRESSLEKWRTLQRVLIEEFRVVVTDVIRNFNIYENWGYAEETRAWSLAPVKAIPSKYWYRSYMFRIETLEDSKGFTQEIVEEEKLYRDLESSTT